MEKRGTFAGRGRLWALAFLLAAVLLGHGRALQGKFLDFDDDRIVTANPLFQGPPGEALVGILDPTRTIADAYLPVSHLSLYLDWRLFGGSPLGLHLSSLIWHFLAAAALYALACRMGLGRVGALLGALLFALHPALVEDTAWISSRKYLLAGLFSFLALSLWLSALEGRRRAGWGALVFVLLAVYSNGAALVLLPWIGLISLFPPVRERKAFPRLPFALICLVVLGAALHHGWIAARAGTSAAGAGGDRTLSMVPAVFAWYLKKAFLPLGLSVDYPYPVYLKKLTEGGLLPWILSLGAAFLAGALLLAGRRGRSRAGRDLGIAGLGLGLFLLGLLPFNDYLPASSVLLADRYLYLPMAGLALALGALASGRVRPGPLWILPPAAGVLVFLPWCFLRAGDFRDSETLWKSVMAVEPTSALAPFNLATERLRRGGPGAVRGREGERIWKLLEEALERARRPQLRTRILRQEAVFLAWKGDLTGSARLLGLACREMERLPRSPAVDREWGRLALERARRLLDAGRGGEARKVTAQVEKRLPGWVEADLFRASLLVERIESFQKAGRREEAAQAAREARPFLEKLVREHPRNYEALRALARLEATRLAGGRFTRAMRLLTRALEVDPRRPQAYLERANIYLAMDPPSVEAALGELEKGLTRLPGNPDLLALKGMIFFQKGRFDQGVAFLEDAWKKAPQRPDLRSALLQALCRAVEESLQKKGADPSKWLEKARALDKEDPEVLRVTGLYSAARGKLRRAVDFLEAALRKGASPGPVRKSLAGIYRKMGYLLLPVRRKAALEAFRKCLEYSAPGEQVGTVPDILMAEIRKLRTLAEEALSRGDRKKASTLLDRALALSHPLWTPQARALVLMDRARQAGRGEKGARAFALEVLRRDLGWVGKEGGKDLDRLLEVKVDSWLTSGRSGKALRVLEIASRLFPATPEREALRAKVLLARGNARSAAALLEKALARWPRRRELLAWKGKLLCLEGLEAWKKRKSLQALDKVARGAALCGEKELPPEADALLREQAARALEAAEGARKGGDWKKALALLDRGIGLLPPGVSRKVRWQALLERGLCLIRLDRPLQALRVLEALDLDTRAEKVPFFPAARARAALLAAMGRTGEARDVVRSWLAAFPGRPGAEAMRGLLERLGPSSRPSSRPAKGK